MQNNYTTLKAKYPDVLFMFRDGDNYELQQEDAKIAAKVLNLPITGTSTEPRVTFTFQSMDTNLSKLVKAGYRVGICDEISAAIPVIAKKPVKRPKPVQLVIGQAIQQPLFS